MAKNDPFSFNTIGFEELFKRLTDMSPANTIAKYPPYNIRQVETNKYVIEMAVAGFSKNEIEIVMENNTLKVTGSVESKDPTDYLYKGISDRPFTKTFALADSVEVKDANMVNGILKIWLDRLTPEENKVKKIEIKTDQSSNAQFLTEGSK